MKQVKAYASAAAGWIQSHVDAGDLAGFVGLAIAYNGAQTVFGTGWARLGLGLIVVTVYVLAELRRAIGGKR